LTNNLSAGRSGDGTKKSHIIKEYKDKIRTVARRVEGIIEIEKCRICKSGLHRLIDIHYDSELRNKNYYG